MPARTAQAIWTGGLKSGKGSFTSGSGAIRGDYGFKTRFEDEPGTNPEELLGAAHAACFSMALAAALEGAGHPPERVSTSARVHLARAAEGWRIPRIELATEVRVAGISDAELQRIAREAKSGCPVSKALGGVEIELQATRAS